MDGWWTHKQCNIISHHYCIVQHKTLNIRCAQSDMDGQTQKQYNIIPHYYCVAWLCDNHEKPMDKFWLDHFVFPQIFTILPRAISLKVLHHMTHEKRLRNMSDQDQMVSHHIREHQMKSQIQAFVTLGMIYCWKRHKAWYNQTVEWLWGFEKEWILLISFFSSYKTESFYKLKISHYNCKMYFGFTMYFGFIHGVH